MRWWAHKFASNRGRSKPYGQGAGQYPSLIGKGFFSLPPHLPGAAP